MPVFTPEAREEEDKGCYRGRPRRQEKRPGFRKDSQIDTILYVDNVGLAWYEGVTLYKTQQKAIVTMDVVPLAFIDRAVDSKTGRQFYQRVFTWDRNNELPTLETVCLRARATCWFRAVPLLLSTRADGPIPQR